METESWKALDVQDSYVRGYHIAVLFVWNIVPEWYCSVVTHGLHNSHVTINNGALNRVNFNTTTYYPTQLLIPRNKNLLYGILTRLATLDLMHVWRYDQEISLSSQVSKKRQCPIIHCLLYSYSCSVPLLPCTHAQGVKKSVHVDLSVVICRPALSPQKSPVWGSRHF